MTTSKAERRLNLNKILILGYGNPAREDDALGPAVAGEIEKLCIQGVTVDSNYQLNVEDSAAIAEYDTVVFVDAASEGEEPFSFYPIKPRITESFLSHSVEPELVYGLSRELFGAKTGAYMLGVRGYSFGMFRENLTEGARENMKEAVRFLTEILKSGSFDRFAKNR
ncbi:MAG: hydrogenase maturation protease [Spirochaetes bacterium]|nr:MAG: hydrogenase maturation protease [Spirochaetota bacterium]